MSTEPNIEPSPPSTFGFGPRESADETRQAQHTQSNDTPTDVNLNAVIGREQAGTFTLMGKNFEANADRRNKIADMIMARLGMGPSNV
jgi:hypothetical protein